MHKNTTTGRLYFITTALALLTSITVTALADDNATATDSTNNSNITAGANSSAASSTASSSDSMNIPVVTTTGTAKSGDQVVQMSTYNVTGSYIPYAADAPAVPVQTVTLDAIKATGETGDLLQVLRKTVPQFVGNGNLGSSNGNIASNSTNGGSGIKLRDVQTLVLINGRRATFAPVGAIGGDMFVDVNSIPVSAVERIEVLSDGASATYGSDAVSGVVNIILKKDYDGAEIGGAYRFSTNTGNWAERSFYATVGAKSGNSSITVSAEWTKTDPIFQNERPFSADQTGKTSNIPGYAYVNGNVYFAVPGKTVPIGTHLSPDQLVAQGYYTGPVDPGVAPSLFNLAPYVTLMLGDEKTGVTVAFDHKFNDHISAFGDILYSKTETFSQLAAQPISGMPAGSDNAAGNYATVDNPYNPFDTNARPRNRLVDFPRQFNITTDTLRLLAGLRGDINDKFSWEGAINYNRADQDYLNKNVLNRTAEANAVDNGLLNMFANGQSDQNIINAGILGTAFSLNKSTLVTADLRLNGEFPGLPAGPIKFAVGAEMRKETLSAEPDSGSYPITDPSSPLYGLPAEWDGATTTFPFEDTRTVKAAFLQIRVPIFSAEQKIPGLHILDLDAAVRHENYSDTSSPTVPKISLRYLPFNDQFAIRASFSKSFTAPTLYDLYGPANIGYSDDITNLKRADGGTIDDAGQAFGRTISNPKLKPEHADNYNVGVVFSPKFAKGLTVEINYFRITQTDIVGLPSDQDIFQSIELQGANSPYASLVRVGSFNGTPITAPGQVSAAYDTDGAIDSLYETKALGNVSTASQDGLDFHVTYEIATRNIGTFTPQLNGTWYHSFKVDGVEYNGTTTTQSTLNGGTIPRYHVNLNLLWQLAGWTANIGTEYIPSVRDAVADAPVDKFYTVDLSLGYSFNSGWLKGLSLRAGVENLFNRMPPAAPGAWPDAGADTTTYGMIGRVIYGSASWKF